MPAQGLQPGLIERAASLSEGEIETLIGQMSETEMREWVAGLSDDEVRSIHANRYDPVYLNLLSMFHKEKPVAEIARIAAECTRNSIWSNRALDRVMQSLPEAAIVQKRAPRFVKGLDVSLLRSLRSDSTGVIICSFRIGNYSLLPIEIAMNGFDLSWPVKDAIFPQLDALLRALRVRLAALPPAVADGTRIQNAGLLHFLPVGDESTSLRMAQALRQGRLVLMQPDGNAGVKGREKPGSRCVVQFMGFPVSVKVGIAHLCWTTGAPILPVIAVMQGMDSGQVVYGKPILKPEPGSISREAFIQSTMQSLYTLLEEYGRKYPEQWPGVAAVHRWRRGPAYAPQPELASRDEARSQVQRELLEGHRYILDQASGVAAVSRSDEWILVHMNRLRSFKAPASANSLLQRLCTSEGLGQSFLNTEAAKADSAQPFDALSLLAEFRRNGLITTA